MGPTPVQRTNDPILPVLRLWEMLQTRAQQAYETHHNLALDWDTMDNDPVLRSHYHRTRGEEETLDVMMFSIRRLAAREDDDAPVPPAKEQASFVYQLFLGALVFALPQVDYSQHHVYRLPREVAEPHVTALLSTWEHMQQLNTDAD